MPENQITKMRLVLADDHPFVREGIRSFLAEFEDIDIVGEAATGAEILAMAEETRPDLILLDINLPDINGVEVLRRLQKAFPSISVLVLSVHNSREYVVQVARAGARGYLPKDVPPEELLQAIRCVQNGGHYYSQPMAGFLYEELGPQPPLHEKQAALSARERQVLVLIAQGKTIKEMADELQVTPSTAQTYRTRLMDKLHIHTVAGLTRYALREKLISLE